MKFSCVKFYFLSSDGQSITVIHAKPLFSFHYCFSDVLCVGCSQNGGFLILFCRVAIRALFFGTVTVFVQAICECPCEQEMVGQ